MPWGDCLENSDVATIGCLEPLFANIVNAVALLSAIALFVFLTIGGFKYLTAGGDPKKTEEARGTITMALVGFVLIMGAYLIISFISVFTGYGGILNFKITFPDFAP